MIKEQNKTFTTAITNQIKEYKAAHRPQPKANINSILMLAAIAKSAWQALPAIDPVNKMFITSRPAIEADSKHVSIANTDIPIWQKECFTLSEAAEIYNIGINRLRDISNDENCPFVMYVGNKRLIKRKPFEAYLAHVYSL